MATILSVVNSSALTDSMVRSAKLVSSTTLGATLPNVIAAVAPISLTQNSSMSPLDTFLPWLRYIAVDVWDELGDPETNNYFWLRGGPWFTWMATIAYLVTVLYFGPRYMKNRPAYDLKMPIRIYNLLLVYINAYLFYHTVINFRYGLDYWGCSASLSLDKRTVLLHYGHLFFHTRYLEFFDTFFFILRKKYNQVTFLHVFHHGVVPTLMYIGMKFYPVPFNVLLPTTNMFVHIIMYAYYGLATFGKEIQKYLWWKKYLTRMQISQFALLIFHCSQPLYLRSCNFPKGLIIINTSIGLVFLLLFSSFYLKTYCSKQRTTTPITNKTGQTDQTRATTLNGGQYVSRDKKSL